MNVLLEIVQTGAKLRPNTKRVYAAAIERWLAFAGTDPRRWTPAEVNRFYAQLLQTVDKPQSVAGILAGLKYASKRYATIHGGQDFAGPIETVPAVQRPAPRPLTPVELHALLATCPLDGKPTNLRDRALILLGLTTGMRRTALCEINVGDFSKAAQGYDVVAITLKGGKRFSVPLLPDVVRAFYPWREWLASWRSGVGRDRAVSAKGISTGRFFRAVSAPTIRNTYAVKAQLTPDGLYKLLRRRADAAGIVGFHPHSLRHTFITTCRAAGVPVHEIASITGHVLKDGGMIDRVYVDPATIGALALERIRPLFSEFFV